MNKTIPLLPCSNADKLIEFYEGLGFQLIGKFIRSYLILEHDEIELHFYGTKQVKPAENSSMCIICTDDVDSLHKGFETGLKINFNHIPRNGFPKITKIRDLSDDRRFTLTDPSGNTFYIMTPKQAGSGTFFRDLDNEQYAKQYAVLYDLVYSKEDYNIANNVLTKMLSVKEQLLEIDRAKLLLIAAEIYKGLGLQYNETELKQLIAVNGEDANWRIIEDKYNEIFGSQSGEL